MAVMSEVQSSTLILTANTFSVHQWIDELLDKTTLSADQIGEYTCERKEISTGDGCHLSDHHLSQTRQEGREMGTRAMSTPTLTSSTSATGD